MLRLSRLRSVVLVVLLALIANAAAARSFGSPPSIETLRVPDGGIQPQAVVGDDGTFHLLYYKGEATGGDLFYTKRGPKSADWSKPLRVNSQPESAVAVGNDRGGQIALGRGGIVHIAWNGSPKATPRGPGKSSPMLYSRLLPGKDSFEPQRNAMTASTELDGGGSIAADAKGSVYIVWHALPIDAKGRGETARRVFVASSSDDGETIAPEAVRGGEENGACGCCGLKASALPDGTVLILYRAAGKMVHRDMHLLRSTDSGKVFADSKIDAWEVGACPMTTASIVSAASGVGLAWETEQRIHWALVSPEGSVPTTVQSEGKKSDLCKYPSIAIDSGGRVLVAWTQGMRWSSGGQLRWQLFNADGKPADGADGKQGGTVEGVPAWSLVAAIAKPEGGFLILY